MESFFYLETSPLYTNKSIIKVNCDKMPFTHGTKGSYGVIIARLLNLSYTDYLRYTRDQLGAELIGKGAKYITPYFDVTPEVNLFVGLLNKRMKLVMFEREHPYTLKRENGEIVKIPFEANENNT